MGDSLGLEGVNRVDDELACECPRPSVVYCFFFVFFRSGLFLYLRAVGRVRVLAGMDVDSSSSSTRKAELQQYNQSGHRSARGDIKAGRSTGRAGTACARVGVSPAEH